MFLRKKLVWPLSLGALSAFVIAIFAPAGGLFVNLGTTFVGILLTVGYVDLILKNHERRKWNAAFAHINKRLESVATVACSQFRTAFGIGAESLNEMALASPIGADRHNEIIRFANGVLKPAISRSVRALTQEDWTHLEKQLQITWDSADRMIQLHSNRLEPQVIDGLMSLQDQMWHIMQLCRTFPDVIGVPDNKLQPNLKGESSIPLKRALEASIANDVQSVLDAAVGLLSYLRDASSEVRT